MARGSKKIAPLFPMEDKTKKEEKKNEEAKGQQQKQPPKQATNPEPTAAQVPQQTKQQEQLPKQPTEPAGTTVPAEDNQQGDKQQQGQQAKGDTPPNPVAQVLPREQDTHKKPSNTPVQTLANPEPPLDPKDYVDPEPQEPTKEERPDEWLRDPAEDIEAEVDAVDPLKEPEEQYEEPLKAQPQAKQKDHLPHGREKDDLEKELAAFRRALEEYKDELEWRTKTEITHNIPVPIPMPVYQKLKELEPYYTTKKIGFLQDQIVKGTIKQVEFLIREVKEKKLKKKRKK
ncbi:hypothetical protein [Laceyella putida]|uniref:Uncharacterized protein n=1 Tax=Laceyella putida TaxID=110101 RepID=A0ABW2RRU7_9BACL